MSYYKARMILRKRKAFTLIELLVVVAIVALLLAILLPSLSKARHLGKRVKCLSNLKAIGLAVHAYVAEDYRSMLPDAYTTGGSVSIETDPNSGETYNYTGWGYRMLTGTKDPYKPRGRTERFGLPAVLNDNGQLKATSGVWVCPSAHEQMKGYGNTYAWSVAAMLEKKSADELKNIQTSWYVWDNFNMWPWDAGFRATTDKAGYSIPSGERDKYCPHIALLRQGESADKSNCVLYYDGHAGVRQDQ